MPGPIGTAAGKIGNKPGYRRPSGNKPGKAAPVADRSRRTEAKSTPKPHSPYRYPVRPR